LIFFVYPGPRGSKKNQAEGSVIVFIIRMPYSGFEKNKKRVIFAVREKWSHSSMDILLRQGFGG
jgi:hypothetical protein